MAGKRTAAPKKKEGREPDRPRPLNQLIKEVFTEAQRSRAAQIIVHTAPPVVQLWGETELLSERSVPAPLLPGLVSKLKKLARLDIADRRTPQQGSFRMLESSGLAGEFIVKTLPDGTSENLTVDCSFRAPLQIQ